MISALSWIPRGAARAEPEEVEMDEEELKQLVEKQEEERQLYMQLQGQEDDEEAEDEDDEMEQDTVEDHEMAAAEDDTEESKNKSDDPNDISEYNLDNYDDEEDVDYESALFASTNKTLGGVIDPQDDPFLLVKDDSDDEIEDYILRPTDLLLVGCKNEEELSTLEVYVYEENEDNLYLHHDILLPAYPLCLSWLDYNRKAADIPGNFCAVGTFEPHIEIWNLDVLDPFEPAVTLGGYDIDNLKQQAAQGKNKKKKKNVKPKLKPGSHSDAVMSLSWNSKHRNFLASGSADKTVKIWDITTQTCKLTLTHHKDKVQSLQWNIIEPHILLSGSFDKRAAVLDPRQPNAALYFAVSADVENLAWNPHTAQQFVVACEDGHVLYFDARVASNNDANKKAVFTLAAHQAECNSVAFNPIVPGMLATGSADKMVKVWDVSENKPSLVSSKNVDQGIFTVTWIERLLACSGDKGKVVVWNVDEDNDVLARFPKEKNLVATPYFPYNNIYNNNNNTTPAPNSNNNKKEQKNQPTSFDTTNESEKSLKAAPAQSTSSNATGQTKKNSKNKKKN